MIRALLDGRKTQTRRQLYRVTKSIITSRLDGRYLPIRRLEDVRIGETLTLSRAHDVKPGDRLWVREAFSYDSLDVDHDGLMPCWYWADGNPEDGDWTKPKPSIHMPRIYSRLTLTVTDVRVQRLQDISEADAEAEGVEYRDCWGTWRPDGSMQCGGSPDRREAFRCLWININGNGSWEADPWVCAYTFHK